jgi:hypothetical protein
VAVNSRNFKQKYPIISSYLMILKNVAKHHKSTNVVSIHGWGYLKWETAKEFLHTLYRININYSDDYDDSYSNNYEFTLTLRKNPDFEEDWNIEFINGYLSINVNDLFDYDEHILNFLEKCLYELQFNKNLTTVLNEN